MDQHRGATDTHWAGFEVRARDPLVLGQGGIPSDPSVQRDALLLPLPTTLAGMVRTAMMENSPNAALSDEAARALLNVQVRGPWLIRDGKVWLPAPLDAWASIGRSNGGEADAPLEYFRAECSASPIGENTLGPTDLPPAAKELRALVPPNKGADPKKWRSPGQELPRFWSLDDAVRWSVSREKSICVSKFEGIERENRTHVKLGPRTLTAEAGMLFTTPALRYSSELGVGLQVKSHAHWRLPESGQPVRLGAKARAASIHDVRAEALQFPEEEYRKAFKTVGDLQGVGLRLQLVTPGCLDGGGDPKAEYHPQHAWFPHWLQSASPQIPKLAAFGEWTLHAMSMPERAWAVSGWNMRENGSKRIRRLIPPGTVYLLSPKEAGQTAGLSEDRWIELCQALWFQTIFASETKDHEHFLAAPAAEGFGVVLPGFWQCTPPKVED